MRVTIPMRLDPHDIGVAIREIEGHKKELQRRLHLLTETLVLRGVETAKLYVKQMDANFTGLLESSIEGYYNPHLHAGWIMAGTPYAIFVEYGTGVVGEGTDPYAQELENAGWVYDINGHGEDGWTYYDALTDTFRHTAGMAARPFMAMTAETLYQRAEKIAQEVFGR